MTGPPARAEAVARLYGRLSARDVTPDELRLADAVAAWYAEHPAPECRHENTWFDRTICPEPCGGMHTRCSDCGKPEGHCCWEGR